MIFNTISVFDEKKIISPEKAYGKRMYPNKELQVLMKNHEWGKIDEGIQQIPSLGDALFIIREGYENFSDFTADFGTILYQLIAYRQNNLDDFDKKDLLQLDKLIFKMRKKELLKVQLQENLFWVDSSGPKKLILLESEKKVGRTHLSQQYTVANTELAEESRVLKKCIKNAERSIYG